MEFPTDVLGLIREFSRPRMQFVPEFNKAMLELDGCLHIQDECIKRRLCDKDAPHIMEVLLKLVDFKQDWDINFEKYIQVNDIRTCMLKVAERDTLRRKLYVLVLGEKEVRMYERQRKWEAPF